MQDDGIEAVAVGKQPGDEAGGVAVGVVDRAEGVEGEAGGLQEGSIGGVEGEHLALAVELGVGGGEAADAVGGAAGARVQGCDEMEDAHRGRDPGSGTGIRE